MLGWKFTPGAVPGGFNIEGSSPPGGVFGGGEAEDPQEIRVGWMAHCRDDQGLEIALWQGSPGA